MFDKATAKKHRKMRNGLLQESENKYVIKEEEAGCKAQTEKFTEAAYRDNFRRAVCWIWRKNPVIRHQK